MTFSELLNLRKKVNDLNEPEVLSELVTNGSIEILSLSNNEYFFLLSAKEILHLNELIEELFEF